MAHQFPKNRAVLLNPDLLVRPELSAHIAVISVIWNEIDCAMGEILSSILGIDAKIGISIYLSVENDGAKSAILKSVAAERCSEKHLTEFVALMKELREKRAGRNKIVHGVWAVPEEHPECLLWIGPKQLIQSSAEHWQFIYGEKTSEFPNEGLYLYSKKDFEDIATKGKDILRSLRVFAENMFRFYGMPSINYARQVSLRSPSKPARQVRRKTSQSDRKKRSQ